MFRRKGFTIIELLIVISVIAILVGIALPRFRGMQDEGNVAKAHGELRTLQTAVESYREHHTTYPADIATATLSAATPQIIATAPTDPFNPGNGYQYIVSENGSYYVIFSYGPGRTANITAISDAGVLTGGADDIWVSNGTSPTGG